MRAMRKQVIADGSYSDEKVWFDSGHKGTTCVAFQPITFHSAIASSGI